MLISVSPNLASIFTRSSSLALNTLSDFKFTLQLLTREPFKYWPTNTLPSTFCYLSCHIILSIWDFVSYCKMNIFPTFNFIDPTQTTIGLRNIRIHNFVFIGIYWLWMSSYCVCTFDNTSAYVVFSPPLL